MVVLREPLVLLQQHHLPVSTLKEKRGRKTSGHPPEVMREPARYYRGYKGRQRADDRAAPYMEGQPP